MDETEKILRKVYVKYLVRHVPIENDTRCRTEIMFEEMVKELSVEKENKITKKEFEDKHGYEIMGLEAAKTKKARVEALRSHIHWTEMKAIEVMHDLKERLQQLEI